MFEKQAKIEGTVKQIEDTVWIEVRTNLTFGHRVAQQFARLDSPGFNPMDSKGLQYFGLGLSRSDHGGDDLAKGAAKYSCPPSHLLVNGLQYWPD